MIPRERRIRWASCGAGHRRADRCATAKRRCGIVNATAVGRRTPTDYAGTVGERQTEPASARPRPSATVTEDRVIPTGEWPIYRTTSADMSILNSSPCPGAGPGTSSRQGRGFDPPLRRAVPAPTPSHRNHRTLRVEGTENPRNTATSRGSHLPEHLKSGRPTGF
jgi:hypothetical protein